MWNVISFEVLRALKKRSFWVASILPPLIILVVVGIVSFSAKNAGTTSTAQTQAFLSAAKIAVLDDSGLVSPSLLAAGHIASEPSQAAGIAAVKSGALNAFFYYPADVSTSGIQIYAQAQGIGSTPYNAVAIGILKESVSAQVTTAVHNAQAVQLLEQDPPVTATTYQNGVPTNELADIIAPGLFAIAFFLFLIMLSPFIISSTTEEKENRAAEILLTSIKTRTLIGGKMVSILVLGIVQAAVVVVPLLIAAVRFPALINLPGGVSLSQIPLNPMAITIGALFLTAGLALFTGLMMGLGAMVAGTNSNRFIGVFMICAFIPIYSLSLIISSPQSFIVVLFTYFPLTAPTTVLFRNAIGNLSLGTALLSFVIVAVSAVLAILFAMRAFRYGAMEHGRRVQLKELLR